MPAGTLLCDLLTPGEELDGANVFDIGLLAGRLAEVTGWLRAQPRAAQAAIGYFGASTGTAAAAPILPTPACGRDRTNAALVGERDEVVLDLNRRAQAELHCENDLAVVPGATHQFEEPGTLGPAAGLARDWFISHLTQ